MLKIVLRKKIIFLFLFFGLLPLAVAFFLTITQIQKSLRETTNNNLTSLANEVVSSVEKTVRSISADVELLSANPLIRSREASNEEKLSEIKRVQDFYGIFEDITLIDLDGNVIISSTYKYRGEWKNKQWYQDAKQGKSSISPAYIILGPYKVILSCAAPVKDEEGKIMAVIAGQVNMEKIWETTDKVKIGEKGFVFMVNKEARFVAYPKKEKILTATSYSYFNEEIFSGNSGIINYIDENNQKMIGGFVSFSEPKLIEQLGWRLIVAEPEKEALALVNTFQKQVVVIFLAGLILLLIISYLLGSRIVVPIKKLITATKKFAIGKLESKIQIKTGDEIEELAESFNQMAGDLKKSRVTLEESRAVLEIKVNARTKELQELAEKLEEKVGERTKELQKRLAELERFHRLTVGRELKMIELKKKLRERDKKD
ncbi:MAG: cache domain-containing protein [Candidatus Gribaldobacteria bacterium]|nr:cache domain-containing protein [Candidatus Gribaldobacteria bacterium]